MKNTTFRDSLMIDNWDTFQGLVEEIKDIKALLKNERRRKNTPVCSYSAYRITKQIHTSIAKVLKGKRMNNDTALEQFAIAIRKVNILVRELLEYGRHKLAKTFQKIEQTLAKLLPQYAVIQLELFELEYYHQEDIKPLTTCGFRKWLKYLFATLRLGLNYQAVSGEKCIHVVQLPLNLKLP